MNSEDIYTYTYQSCENIEVPFSAELGEGANTTQNFQSTYYNTTKIELIDPTHPEASFKGWKIVKGK